MKRTFGVLLGLLLTGLAAAGATNDITGALQRGLFEEEANHNLAAAIQAYESVIERFDKDRKLAATAVFRLGECYRKQGRTNDALVQYRRVVSEFADQSAVVNLSRQHLAASGVTAEVAEGGGPSPEQLEKAEIERLSRLILESPDLVNAKSAEGLTPLQQAVVKGQFQVAEYLLAKGAQADSKALSLAIGRGDRAMVEFLIQKGAPLDSGTPLHLAAQKGYRSIAELLIEKGANVNAIDSPARETPLHIAAKNGFRSTAELLLQKGAGVNAMSALGTPLHAAVQSGQEALVAMLLEAKPDLEKTYQGYTPLHSAVNRGNLQIAELLLKAGADVNSDKYNQAGQVRTPLMDAVETGNLPMTDLLLRFKADPNRPSYPGSSNPLKIAINKSNLALVKLLLEAGADIQSEPILTYDTTLGSPAIVKTLLDRG
ncbi:MAG TPA: ankyrin repeat domain-containing protein, partial [Clostridia bacterium]|nr:ankyrin repeat domain-containing protein [Clostridia bacterium]